MLSRSTEHICKKRITDETPKMTEQTKSNISSFLFAIMIQ